METFFNQFNSSVPVDLHSPEVAHAINKILNESVVLGCVDRVNAVATLRSELSAEVVSDDGGRCDVCGSLNKIYPRSLTKGMVKSLARLYDLGATQRAITIRQLGANGGDHAKLRFWGLVYHEADPVTGSSKGWRVSNNGVRFLGGSLSVPKIAYLFQNNLIGWSLDEVALSISEFKRFEIQSLMNRPKGKIMLAE